MSSSEFYLGVIGTSTTGLEATSASEIKRVTLCKATNKSEAPVTVTFWAVDSGDTEVDGDILLDQFTIPVGQTTAIPMMHGEVIGPSRTLKAAASAGSAITLRVVGTTTTTT